MNAGVVLQGVQRLGLAAADAAVARIAGGVSARAASVPGVTAEAGVDMVLLSGRGLLARAYGSRRRAADPAIRGLTMGDGR